MQEELTSEKFIDEKYVAALFTVLGGVERVFDMRVFARKTMTTQFLEIDGKLLGGKLTIRWEFDGSKA